MARCAEPHAEHRLRVLVFVNRYLPGYRGGGPARSISNLVDALGDEIDFSVVTSDRDAGDARPYEGVQVNEWNRVGKARVYYLRVDLLRWGRIRQLLRAEPHDMVYLNSYFSWTFTIGVLLLEKCGTSMRRPIVVAPRGELQAGALSIKPWKKSLFLSLARAAGLYDGVVWQATSVDEAQGILKVHGSDARIAIATNLASRAQGSVDASAAARHRVGVVRVAWISRVARKKNLLGAVDIVRRCQAQMVLDVYGPLEDPKYWAECQRLVELAPASVQVRYCGELEHKAVRAMFAEHDVFLFPTLGENFGHVILEALTAGCPVLTSDQTPWHELEAMGAGWEVPLGEPERAAQILDEMAEANDSVVQARRVRARQYGERIVAGEAAVEQNRRLFQEAIVQRGGGRKGRDVRGHFDRLAKDWHQKYKLGGSMEGRRERFLGALRAELPGGGRLLDFGCGSGSLSVEFARRGWVVTAIDCAGEMIEMARQLDSDNTVQFSQIESGAGELPFRDGSFDAVVASSVFEYLSEPEATARELRRVVRAGGVLVATVPNSLHPVRWAEAVEKRARQAGVGARGALRREYLELSQNRTALRTWRGLLGRAGWRVEFSKGRTSALLLLVARAD